MRDMTTRNLRLRRGGDGYYRTGWTDAQGRKHARSFGRERGAAEERFAAFYLDWRTDPRVRAGGDTGEITCGELWARYAEHADREYRNADGTPTGEATAMRYAFAPLLALFADVPARDMGPRMLKAARAEMVRAGLCRNECNKRARKIRTVFRWAASEELVPGEVWHRLGAVEALKPGAAVEIDPGVTMVPRCTDPVGPVPDADVDAVVAELSPVVAAMVRFQWWTGARPGEVCGLRPIDVDVRGALWLYRPPRHKLARRAADNSRFARVVLIGPNAQAVLRPWLTRDPYAYCWTPRESEAARYAARGTHRHTPVEAAATGRRLGVCYTAHAYGRAIWYAVQRVNARRLAESGDRAVLVEAWSPNRLRHNALTRYRAADGLDVAQIVAGHARVDTTQVYAEANRARAESAVRRLG